MILPLLTQVLQSEGEWAPLKMEFNPAYAQDLSYSLVENEHQNFSYRLLFSLL